MKNSKGVSLIALIITIIVIIILAAIVMNSSTDTVGNAQYARFAQEFGEFADQIALDAADIKSQTGIKGQIINTAQNCYMVANGFTALSGDKIGGISGFTMPVGYVLTDKQGSDSDNYMYVLQNLLHLDKSNDAGKTLVSGDGKVKAQVAYVINDGKITNYTKYGNNPTNGEASHEFYGDSNGKEYHFITSDGQVFTLPGYPVEQSDGTVEYHINTQSNAFYVVLGNGASNGLGVGSKNVNGDTITNTRPILASYLTDKHGLDSDNKVPTSCEINENATKIG